MISWLWQRFSGIGLLVLLFIHLGISHLRPLTYEDMQMRLSSPFWLFFNFSLLELSVSHALNGLWQIGQDYIVKETLRGLLALCLWLMGGFLSLLGLLLLLR